MQGGSLHNIMFIADSIIMASTEGSCYELIYFMA